VGLTVSAAASETLLVWEDVAVAVGCTDLGCYDHPMGLRALRVTAEGHPVGTSFEMAPGDPAWQGVVWSAPDWFVFWSDGDGIQGRRLREGLSVPGVLRHLDLSDFGLP
jgi:hypothetical protein